MHDPTTTPRQGRRPGRGLAVVALATLLLAAVAGALGDVWGDVTPATAAEAIKATAEQDLPGGGGVKFQCGGSAIELMPAVCTNGWLRATLDDEGRPASYEAIDSTDILTGL